MLNRIIFENFLFKCVTRPDLSGVPLILKVRLVYYIIIGYNTAMVCQGAVLAHLRQYWPEGFSPRANVSEGVPIRARGIP